MLDEIASKAMYKEKNKKKKKKLDTKYKGAYKRFPNLKELMVYADPYNIKPLKEIDQDSGCSYCMKRCDS